MSEKPTVPLYGFYAESARSFDEAFGLLENALEQIEGNVTLIMDIDGVLNEDSMLFDRLPLRIYEERLEKVANLLQQYPNLNVAVITTRLSIYQWTDWLPRLKSALQVGEEEPRVYQMTDRKDQEDLERNIAQRSIIVNVAKTSFERAFFRSISPFIRQGQDGEEVVFPDSNPLEYILTQILAHKGDGAIFVLDESDTMKPVLEELSEERPEAGLRYFSINRKIQRIHIEAGAFAVLTAFAIGRLLVKKLLHRRKN